MYIEFTGCSGSGKTTVSGRLIHHLQKPGRNIVSIHPECFSVFGPRYRFVGHTSLQNLLLDLSGVRRNLRSTESRSFLGFANGLLRAHRLPFPTRLNLLRSVARKLGVHQLMRERDEAGSLALVDEGTVHAAHNLLIYANEPPREEEILAFTERVPLPDGIVVVRAPLERMIQRTLARADRPISGDENAIGRYLENGQLVFEQLFSSARLRDRAIFLDYDRDSLKLADELAVEVVGKIDSLLGRA